MHAEESKLQRHQLDLAQRELAQLKKLIDDLISQEDASNNLRNFILRALNLRAGERQETTKRKLKIEKLKKHHLVQV